MRIKQTPARLGKEPAMKCLPRWPLAATVLGMLAILSSGAWFYAAQRQDLRKDAERALDAVAELKVGQIALWRAERLGDVSVLMEPPLMTEAVARWMADPQAGNAQPLLGLFRSLQTQGHYSDILLVDAAGKARLSLSGMLGPLDADARSALTDAFRDRRAVLSQLHTAGDHPAPHLGAVAPFFAGDGSNAPPLGAVILWIEAGRSLYPLIQSWPTPSASAETLLVWREDDSVLCANELRHQHNTGLKLRFPLSQTNTPEVMAVLGKAGVFQSTDYRGVEVLAALRAVPDSPWFVVAKMDAAEAFEARHFRSVLILAVLLGSLALVGAVILVIWQNHEKAYYRALLNAESTLRQAEERYRVTLMSVGDGVIATDAQGRVELMNEAAEKLVGWSQDEARSKPLEDVFRIVSEQTGQGVEDPVQRVVRKGKVVGLANHTTLVARDGTQRPIADSGAPIRDPQGEITGVVLVLRDQTAERAAQQALAANERRLKLALEGANDGIWEVDLLTQQVYLSPRGCEMLGYGMEEFAASGQSWDGIVHPEDLPHTHAALQDHLSGRTPLFAVEQRMRTRAGNWKWILARGKVAEFDAAGQAVRMMGTHSDITERKRLEEERGIHARLLSLLNGSSNLHELMREVTRLLHESFDCEAVGIRLAQGNDFPYFETRGFPAEFVRAESQLCVCDAAGQPARDAEGRPVLDCMCGNVLCGRFNPAQPFFTARGSFCCNGTSDLLASTTDADRLSRTRNRCNGAGYESVALVALRVGETTYGLLQVNDKRKDRFTPQRIALLERLADSLANAIAHRQGLETLRESEGRYRSLFENMLNGFAFCRMHFEQGRPQDFTYLEVNAAFENLTGLKNVVGKRVTEVIPGIREADPALFEIYGRVAQTGAPARFETYVQALQMWFEIAVYCPAKEHFVAVFDVITERKRAQEALLMAHARLRGFVDSNIVGIVIANAAGTVIEANDYYLRLIGFTRAELEQGRIDWRAMTPPQWLPADEEAIRELRERGVCAPYEKEYVRRDGTRVPVLLADTLLPGPDEELTAFVLDLTARKRAEEELLASEIRYRRLFEAAKDGVIILDAETGMVVDVNPFLVQLLGFSRGAFLGRKIWELGSFTGIVANEADFAPLRQQEYIRYDDKSLKTAAGRRIDVEFVSNVYEVNRRKVIQCNIRDITERKLTEWRGLIYKDQLRALSARIETMREEERTRISREIHDELGQMLTGIKMDLRWMEHRLDEFGEDRRVNPILDKLVATAELTDATVKTVQRIAAELRPGMLDKLGLPITLQFEAARFEERTGIACKLVVPSEALPLPIEAATAFFRIFQEALTNVSRHAKATTVEVVLQMEADGCCLEIRDNGQGMAGVDLTHLKSLGLLGMQERASALGGGASFASRPGGGTVVTVRIPNRPAKQGGV